MGAAGNVQEQPVRQVERHQRREAIAPVGDVLQRLAVGGLVRIIDSEFGTDGARIGERQADGETCANGVLVDGVEKNSVVVLCNNDLREVFLRLSRLRGRPYRIARCDTGGGSLHTGSRTRGSTPTPTLPRKREREAYHCAHLT